MGQFCAVLCHHGPTRIACRAGTFTLQKKAGASISAVLAVVGNVCGHTRLKSLKFVFRCIDSGTDSDSDVSSVSLDIDAQFDEWGVIRVPARSQLQKLQQLQALSLCDRSHPMV